MTRITFHLVIKFNFGSCIRLIVSIILNHFKQLSLKWKIFHERETVFHRVSRLLLQRFVAFALKRLKRQKLEEYAFYCACLSLLLLLN